MPQPRVVARLSVTLYFATSVVLACTCLPQGVRQDLDDASIVFRGVVTSVEKLPTRKEGGRQRYAVTFTVSRYWKGNPGEKVTMHIVEPGTDCIGAHFDEGNEYVVFAISQEARDYQLEDRFWYGWLDILPGGTQLLTVNNFCDSTAEVKKAGKTLRALGRGRTPRA